jgi:hypothetical protein
LNYGMVVFSDDDGESWTSPKLVIDTDGEGPIRTDHVVVWTAPDGVLWVVYDRHGTDEDGPWSILECESLRRRENAFPNVLPCG